MYDDIVAEVGYYNHRSCTPTWETEEDRINFVDITYIMKGQAEYKVDSKKYIVSAGDLLCIPKGSIRSAISSPDDLMECYCVNGKVHDLNGGEIKLPFPVVCHIGLQQDIISLYRDMNAEWLLRDPGYNMKVRAIYLMILQRFFQLIIYKNDSSTVDKRIKRVLRYIIDHYAEPLTVQGMADFTGLSAMYFGNFFRKETGMSFRQYLTSIRLNHAEDMLHSGEYNVNEVSVACGFSDIFYFSKVFKESRGISPSKLIRSGRKTVGTT
ncbi:MAG: helix-turn-helix domain-containing protein [Acetanaerobacterium sp.]